MKRYFRADRPDALWVTDLTYVPTRSGMAYVCFIVDAFSRRIVGWRVAGHMRTDMVLDAVALALNTRPRKTLGWRTPAEALDEVLSSHTNPLRRPVEPALFTSVRFTEPLDEIGARPSIGTVADCPLSGQSGLGFAA